MEAQSKYLRGKTSKHDDLKYKDKEEKKKDKEGKREGNGICDTGKKIR